MDLAMGEELEKVHQLLEFCLDVSERYCLAQVEQGAHATSIGDSPSGPDVISPAYYREFAYPYVEELISQIKENEISSWLTISAATPRRSLMIWFDLVRISLR